MVGGRGGLLYGHVIALLVILPALLVPKPGDVWEPVVGFVNHFPMVRHMDDRLGESGANVVILRAPWPLLEPEEGRFDFRMLDEQLELAKRQGVRVVTLMEAGPAHAAGVGWLMEKLRAAGETQCDPEGRPARDPSPFGPIYRRYLSRYLRAVAAYVRAHPLGAQVYGYNNGCEWWFPLSQSYGPLAENAFREYLRRRYRSLDALNRRWGSDVRAWDDVRAPRLIWLGTARATQGVLIPASAQLDACYATDAASHIPVQPGRKLTFTAHWKGQGITAGGVTAEIAFLGPEGGPPIAIHQSPLERDGRAARCIAEAPAGAVKAWLLAKSMAVGEVTFMRLSCTDETGAELAPNPNLDPASGGWTFIRWSAGTPERVHSLWEKAGAATIRYDAEPRLDTPAAYPLAAVADWTDFRARAMAEFVDWMGREIRAADPTRPVVSYLTFAFANPFEWDYAQQMAIQLEHWAPAARNQQILGMQLASAEGDFDSVTCALDMVRKYGKPMWAVDLLDFTRGTALGPPALTALSRAVFDHGGTGIQYYCWWGTPHYNYLDLGMDALRSMIADVRAHAARTKRPAPRAEVALVMPRMPLFQPLPEPANDWADFMGWYKALRRHGVRTDVYALEELGRADLRRHRLIIVPDCAYMEPEGVANLARAASAGVRVAQSGRFALRDMSGRPNDGTRSARIRFYRRSPEPLGAKLLGRVYRQTTPTDTPPRLVCEPGYPDWNGAPAQQVAEWLRDAGVLHQAAPQP